MGLYTEKGTLFEEHLSTCIHHTARCKNRTEDFVQASRCKYVHPNHYLEQKQQRRRHVHWLNPNYNSFFVILVHQTLLHALCVNFMYATDVLRHTKPLQTCSVPAECH